jgi:hypothetical protein
MVEKWILAQTAAVITLLPEADVLKLACKQGQIQYLDREWVINQIIIVYRIQIH